VKTDSIFYRLFQEFPSIFFELIGNPPEAANAYQFSSVEIKQTAFRLDGVFLPAQEYDNPVYFVEVQFQPDSEFYSRFFAEIFLYLRQNKPQNNWRAVVLYPTQSVDTGELKHYREFFASQRVSRVYLDELGGSAEQSIGIGTVKLVISPEESAVEQARSLIDKVRHEIVEEVAKQEFVQLIEIIMVYKFPKKSREEIEQMLGLSDLKQTKVYQEALLEGKREGRLEGKLESVPRFLALGLSVEQIAEALGLGTEAVRQAAQNQPSD